MIQNLSLWSRELPVGDRRRDPHLRPERGERDAGRRLVGQRPYRGGAAGSWTPGHSGSSVLGAVRTNAALPLTTAATVSLWVRRDGPGLAYPRILGFTSDAFELADINHGNVLGVWTPSLGWQSTSATFASGFHHVAVTAAAGRSRSTTTVPRSTRRLDHQPRRHQPDVDRRPVTTASNRGSVRSIRFGSTIAC